MNQKRSFSDISVIGAGPVGSLAAWQILHKRSDISVAIFEEHAEIGRPPHCSGLFSIEGFIDLGLNLHDLKKKISNNAISRAKFIGPNFKFFEIHRGYESMIVFDRIALDQYLANRARKKLAEYNLNHKVKKIKFNNGEWEIKIDHNKEKLLHKSKILISAEGVHAKLARSVGIPIPDKKWLFPAIQHEFERVIDVETDCVELFFGKKFAPGFFGWFIPINEDSARLGVAVGRWAAGNTRLLMKNFLQKHPYISQRIKKSKLTNNYGGFVPGTGPSNKTYTTNFMASGDVVGQSKATTGGGVNIGGFCGRIAGSIAQKIITEEITANEGCKKYQQLWKSRFEPDLTLMKLFRRMMTPLPDKAWNEIIKIAKDTDIGDSLKRTGIDLHGLGLLKYSLSPRVFIKGLHLIPQATVGILRGLTY